MSHKTTDYAAESGHLSILEHVAADYTAAESIKGARDSRDAASSCPFTEYTVGAAAIRSHIHILSWLDRKGFLFGKDNGLACSAAAGGGHLATVFWLRGKGFDWDEHACGEAAGAGRLDVLTAIRAAGCPWVRTTTFRPAFVQS